MFIGHFALAFAAKPIARNTSLGTLMLAAQWLDLVWPTLLLIGVERVLIDPSLPGLTPLVFVHYPYTHSLLAALLWAAAFGAVYGAITRNGRGALLVAALVLSHWLLDAVVHRPDLLLAPGSDIRVGLGLWQNAPAGAVAVELLLFVGGATLYLRSLDDAMSWRARVGVVALIAALLAIQIANVLGPPPPSVQAIAWVGQAQWLLVAAGYALDRKARAPRDDSDAASAAT